MEFGRVYLDSNILISLLSGEAGAGVQLLIDMIGAVGRWDSAPFATSELTLAEALVRPYREANTERILAVENVITSGPWLEVGPVERQVLLVAAHLRAKYRHLRLPDAIHVATAIGFGCSHLLTADAGIRESYAAGEMRWSTPQLSTPVQIIRPDAPTLRSIIEWLSAP